MEKYIKIQFLKNEIKLEANYITECDTFKAITCLLEQISKESYNIIRKALTNAEKEYKENKND